MNSQLPDHEQQAPTIFLRLLLVLDSLWRSPGSPPLTCAIYTVVQGTVCFLEHALKAYEGTEGCGPRVAGSQRTAKDEAFSSAGSVRCARVVASPGPNENHANLQAAKLAKSGVGGATDSERRRVSLKLSKLSFSPVGVSLISFLRRLRLLYALTTEAHMPAVSNRVIQRKPLDSGATMTPFSHARSPRS